MDHCSAGKVELCFDISVVTQLPLNVVIETLKAYWMNKGWNDGGQKTVIKR